MTRDERLRAVSAILRTKHEDLADLVRGLIVDMFDTLDTLDRTVQAAKRTAVAAERAVKVNRKMLAIIDKAHTATMALYEHDRTLTDAIDSPDREPPS